MESRYYLTDSRKFDALPDDPENFRRHTTAKKMKNFLEQSMGQDPERVIPPRNLDVGVSGRDESSGTSHSGLPLAAEGFTHLQSVNICRESSKREVLVIRIAIFCDVTPCCFVNRYQNFEGSCCHLYPNCITFQKTIVFTVNFLILRTRITKFSQNYVKH